MEDAGDPFLLRPPEIPLDPMEYLSRSWSASALQISKEIAPSFPSPSLENAGSIAEDSAGENELSPAPPSPLPMSGSSFSFASAATSQLVLERIMSREVSPQTSGRLSHSSGYLTDSPSFSHSDQDFLKHIRAVNATAQPQIRPPAGGKSVGRWLKDRREKKKEETRVHNAQVHAALSVAGVAAAVAAVATATAAAAGLSNRSEQASRMDIAVASAATLLAAQCAEAAEALGAQHDQLAAVIGSAVSVRTPGDILTLTAAAATALRGASTLKARVLREVWNIAAVIPVEKNGVNICSQFDHCLRHRHHQRCPMAAAYENDFCSTGSSGEILSMENFLGVCSQDVLAGGAQLLKRTRKGSLHWKIVSVYISKMNQVILKMKSKHIAGTITKKKKSVVVEICREVPAWPGRHLLEGGEKRRYFGLKTVEGRVIEFECKTQREHDLWTQGVAHLLDITGEGRNRRTSLNG
ncbi:hypothetical protein KSP40_PGU018132 [Platanthera guangdongensis]|uniref:VAN3-binding protein n=1 Tax=Platanthera guangdongensis TaxID=2320717 RepID=A0ABR2MWU0_9ASPA